MMNFVDSDGESEPWKSFWTFVYMWTVEGITSDSLVYLFAYRLSICTKIGDLERRNGHYFSEFGSFCGHYVKVID